MAYKVYFDGACEPVNPGGTGGIGVLVYRSGELIYSAGRIIGRGPEISSNVAEYAALIEGLKFLILNDAQSRPVLVCGDSKLVIEQMAGRWKIRGGLYLDRAMSCKALVSQFKDISFKWIPRELNREADRLSKCGWKRRNSLINSQEHSQEASA